MPDPVPAPSADDPREAEILDVNDLALALAQTRQNGSGVSARFVYDSHEALRAEVDRLRGANADLRTAGQAVLDAIHDEADPSQWLDADGNTILAEFLRITSERATRQRRAEGALRALIDDARAGTPDPAHPAPYAATRLDALRKLRREGYSVVQTEALDRARAVAGGADSEEAATEDDHA